MATAIDVRVKEVVLDMVKICKALNVADQSDEQVIAIINDAINKLAAHKNTFRIANKGQSLEKLIEESNKLKRLSDEQIDALKSGFDGWSNLTYEQVLKSFEDSFLVTVKIALQEAFGTDIKLKARAARWIARGLKINHAIAKIKYETDLYGN